LKKDLIIFTLLYPAQLCGPPSYSMEYKAAGAWNWPPLPVSGRLRAWPPPSVYLQYVLQVQGAIIVTRNIKRKLRHVPVLCVPVWEYIDRCIARLTK